MFNIFRKNRFEIVQDDLSEQDSFILMQLQQEFAAETKKVDSPYPKDINSPLQNLESEQEHLCMNFCGDDMDL